MDNKSRSCFSKIKAFDNSFEIISCNNFNKNLPNYCSHITYSMKILLIELLSESLLLNAKQATLVLARTQRQDP